MKHWIKLTDEYVNNLEQFSRHTIRFQNGQEKITTLDKCEGCFFWNSGDDAVYMNEPDVRPTHILVE